MCCRSKPGIFLCHFSHLAHCYGQVRETLRAYTAMVELQLWTSTLTGKKKFCAEQHIARIEILCLFAYPELAVSVWLLGSLEFSDLVVFQAAANSNMHIAKRIVQCQLLCVTIMHDAHAHSEHMLQCQLLWHCTICSFLHSNSCSMFSVLFPTSCFPPAPLIICCLSII